MLRTDSSSRAPSPAYRPDIDGLRAIAVLLVVAFHYFEGRLGGGFVGVDVFFVISGFLISGIILDAVASRRFSVAQFYGARVRRIFPALVVVLAAVLVAGWVLLLPSEYIAVGRHTVAGAGFLANIAAWREASYFDTAAGTKPLLHLWSLGVEEQFYVCWPLFLIGLSRLSDRARGFALTVCAASLCWSVWLTGTDQAGAFYSPLARVWELAAGGGLAAWLRQREKSESPLAWVMSLAGLAAILGSAVWLGPASRFPGANALWPVGGAALVIAAGPASWVNRRLLGHPTLATIGLISYPLYLWHWPVLVFVRVVTAVEPSVAVRCALIALSAALAVATYRFIERPIRHRPVTIGMVGGLCGLLLAVGLAGWHVMANAGEPGRRAGNAAVAKLLDTAVIADRMLACQGTAGPGDGVVRPCRLGNPDAATPETLVTGDSHAMALAPAFERIAVDARQRIDVVWGAQCPPLVGLESLGADPTAPACRPMNDRVLQYVRDRDIRRVVLVARWSLYTDGSDGGSKGDRLVVMGQSLSAPRTRDASRQALSVALRRTVEAYRAMGASVVLVADVPWQLVEPHRAIRRTLWEADPAAFLRNAAVPRATHQRQQAFANQLLASVSNLDDVYCENDVCPIVEDGASRIATGII